MYYVARHDGRVFRRKRRREMGRRGKKEKSSP